MAQNPTFDVKTWAIGFIGIEVILVISIMVLNRLSER